MEEPIITSDFRSDRLDCLPKVLARRGYSTYFLHGAHNGSMHFDSFARLAGSEHFVGLDEFPKDNPEDFDKYWGVLDEPMLQYATRVIDEAPKPVMLGLFTLSSHNPYYIPPKYAGKFAKGTLPIHESIGYVDYSLQQFFKTAETKPWFKNTIFVITADHTEKSDHKEYQDQIGYYRVPILIYVPGLTPGQVKIQEDRIVQQIDIMPSVLDLLGVNLPDHLLVGHSVFDNGKPGYAYDYTGHSYLYLDSQHFLDFGRPSGPLLLFTHEKTRHMVDRTQEETAQMDSGFSEAFANLKAVIHYLNIGLTHNSLYDWKSSL